MNRGYGNRRSATPARPRWMTLKYAATCDVCGATIPAGETAYWHGRGAGTTCHAIECCETRGLTAQEWHGSPVSGGYITVRTATALHYGFTSNGRGRCEDAPCCGCCD